MAAKKKITKNMTLGEVIREYPETMEVFMKYDIHCVGCHFAAWETIEQGAKVHSVNVKKFVDELNKIVEKSKK